MPYQHKSGHQKRKERKEQKKKDEELKGKNILLRYLEKPLSSNNDCSANPTDTSGTSQLSQAQLSSDGHDKGTDGASNEEEANPDADQARKHADSEPHSDTDDNVQTLYMESETESHTYSSSFDCKDPGNWPETLQDSDRQFIVSVMNNLKTEEELEKMMKGLPLDRLEKTFPKGLLYSKSSNNRETFPRDWIIWSEKNQVLHCVTCLLFLSTISENASAVSQLAKKEGFDPEKHRWRELYDKLASHERSSQHKQCYLQWRQLEKSTKGFGIDKKLEEQICDERNRFSALLRRILDVVLYLASRNLPFRGESEEIGNPHNGNFLGTLELLAKYDPILHEHLQYVRDNQESGRKFRANYLSWRIQNEFIALCAKHVLDRILSERTEAIYYSVICDATPDVSHTEQNVLVLRYVHKGTDRTWSIHERFIEFVNCNKKTGKEIADMILSRLEEQGIDVGDCRGQGYDNGANMSGKVKGVQARILQQSETALFCPCAAHTLNLVGVNAASCCKDAITFFGCVNRIYVLFSSCPERWEILLKNTGCSLHRLSDTRWSARIDAVRPIARKLPSVLQALDEVITSQKYTHEIRSEARGLKTYFSSFIAIFMSTFWMKVLQSINQRSVILQSRSISLEIAARNIEDLSKEMTSLRDQWQAILSEAKHVPNEMAISAEFKAPRRSKRPRRLIADSDASDDQDEEQGPEDSEETFRNGTFYCFMDSIISELTRRFETLNNVCELFHPILDFKDLSAEEISESCGVLIAKYPRDLTTELKSEIVHLKNVYNATFKDCGNSSLDLLNSVYELGLEGIYPELCIALRIFCCLPVSVAQGERSFSKLAIINNHLRSTMTQQRLNGLATLSIEHELAKTIDFDTVIDDFSHMKIRKWSTKR